jgi:hypothetical protein
MSNTENPGRGRPKHVPTEEGTNYIRRLLEYGVPHKRIADIMGMSVNTLYKHYRELCDTIKQSRIIDILDTAYSKAVHDGNVTMLIYLCKVLVGLRENDPTEELNKVVETIRNVNMNIVKPNNKETRDE